MAVPTAIMKSSAPADITPRAAAAVSGNAGRLKPKTLITTAYSASRLPQMKNGTSDRVLGRVLDGFGGGEDEGEVHGGRDLIAT